MLVGDEGNLRLVLERSRILDILLRCGSLPKFFKTKNMEMVAFQPLNMLVK